MGYLCFFQTTTNNLSFLEQCRVFLSFESSAGCTHYIGWVPSRGLKLTPWGNRDNTFWGLSQKLGSTTTTTPWQFKHWDPNILGILEAAHWRRGRCWPTGNKSHVLPRACTSNIATSSLRTHHRCSQFTLATCAEAHYLWLPSWRTVLWPATYHSVCGNSSVLPTCLLVTDSVPLLSRVSGSLSPHLKHATTARHLCLIVDCIQTTSYTSSDLFFLPWTFPSMTS